MGFSTFLIKHLYWLLLFTFLILHLTEIGTVAQFDPSQYPDIQRQERDALYALKARFNNSFLNDNWTGPQCNTDYSSSWHGIQCFNGRVTEISLESMRLSSLLLQDNYLTGPIPEFNQSSLRVFNVSNNDLDGSIPKTHTLQSFGPDSYSSNPQLCGPPTLNTCKNIFATIDVADDQNKESSPAEHPRKSSIPNSAKISVVFIAVGFVVAIFLFFLHFKKARKLKKKGRKVEEREEEEEQQPQQHHATLIDDGLEGEEKPVRSIEEEKGKAVDIEEEKRRLIFIEEEAKSFTLNDLLKASAEDLGKGNFGDCYKAVMDGKEAVVVKRIRDLKPLSSKEFTRQLHIIAHQKHPNLLPLLAYYNSKDEKLLVYKYAEKGNLFNRIHGNRGRDRIPFRWSSRISVALGIARALEYLHLNTISQSIVPHGNLRSTNVLLDLNEKVLVSDYGLSSIIAQPIAAQRLVSYKSPEYKTTKRVSKKSDVWSYGSLLLELLTARISVCSAPPGTDGMELCSWVKKAVREEWTAEIFDIEIAAQRSASSGMLELLQIAIRCCDKSPENRPEMTEVVREVESIKALVESEDEEDLSMDRSLTDESL
ncbi:probable inactive receptor kinase At2g26730 [Populus trichocarpa]|uniref:probable inactive receptor kinase At2g26730 n=1 Tax=Populus trichocarpa TaxID=3694 RepID=UPI002279C2DF|nr:probable inactive receptor kinase At2g26730 [Populus trichocarpa]